MLKRLYYSTKGEIALVLTVIASILILSGIVAGTKVVQLQTQTTSQAAGNPTQTPTLTPAPTSIIPPDCSSAISSWTTSTNTIAPIGPKVATNIHPDDYKQIRATYNCRFPETKSQWIPVTVLYPIDYVHLSDGNSPPNVGNKDAESMKANLISMKNYGLYPIVRIATQYSDRVWIAISRDDSVAIGKALATAIQGANLPIAPIVYFGNEPNLDGEWGGNADAGNYADDLVAFIEGMEGGASSSLYKIYFPPLSYGARGGDIAPIDFLKGVANAYASKGYNRKILGGALTIYEANYTNTKTRFDSSSKDLKDYIPNLFRDVNTASFMVTELGPSTRAENNSDAEKSAWKERMKPVYQGYLNNPTSLGNIVTTAFFDPQKIEHLVVVYSGGSNADILCFAYYGSGPPDDCASNPTPTSTGDKNPTATPGGGKKNPTATPGGGGPNPTEPDRGGRTQESGTMKIIVKVKKGNEKERPWSSKDGKGQVYIAGPTDSGGGFSVVMDIPTKTGTCTTDPSYESGGQGQSFRCEPGVIWWENTAATEDGLSYSVQVSDFPPGLVPTPKVNPGVTVKTSHTATNPLVVNLLLIPGTDTGGGKKNKLTPTPTTAGGYLSYTNADYERVIQQYARGEISALSVSLWLQEATHVPGLQISSCYPPECVFGE